VGRRVLTTGAHTTEACREVREETLRIAFNHHRAQGGVVGGMSLKPDTVFPGPSDPERRTVEAVAAATVACFLTLHGDDSVAVQRA